MKQDRVQIGPGASSLILILVMLAMSVLGMLTFISARNDLRLGLRSVQVTEAVYALNEAGEETFAALCDTLQEAREKNGGEPGDLAALAAQLQAAAGGKELVINDDTISWTEEDALRTLHCEARLVQQAGETGSAAAAGGSSAGAENAGAPLLWTRHELISRSAEMEDEWNW